MLFALMLLGVVLSGVHIRRDTRQYRRSLSILVAGITIMELLGGYEKRRPRSERGPIEASCES